MKITSTAIVAALVIATGGVYAQQEKADKAAGRDSSQSPARGAPKTETRDANAGQPQQ